MPAFGWDVVCAADVISAKAAFEREDVFLTSGRCLDTCMAILQTMGRAGQAFRRLPLISLSIRESSRTRINAKAVSEMKLRS